MATAIFNHFIFMVINLTYNVLYYNHTLWAFRGITAEWLSHSIINIAFTFFIVPIGLMIYLQRFPKHRTKQMIYVSAWVIFYTIIQTLFAHRGMYVYDNGWNGWMNILLNAALFVVVYVHYRRPVRAIVISIPLAILFYLMFPFPLDTLK
ncbi:CBO0543 family protein [Piscibacillus salipiscarius]|uniref:CBO0543 family protein n=1 Tax=Piscibacillus salipiscarius TaxID=299480 RepID=UPI0006D0265A|nr:CBO0543 family protein [Piscibacillus salipiscarius]